MSPVRRRVAFAALAALLIAATSSAQEVGGPKTRRTLVQRKIDSALLQAIERLRNDAAADQVSTPRLQIDKKQRVLVAIRIRLSVGPEFQRWLTRMGATVMPSTETNSVIAWVPLAKLEQLAGDASVRAINPAPKPARPR